MGGCGWPMTSRKFSRLVNSKHPHCRKCGRIPRSVWNKIHRQRAKKNSISKTAQRQKSRTIEQHLRDRIAALEKALNEIREVVKGTGCL